MDLDVIDDFLCNLQGDPSRSSASQQYLLNEPPQNHDWLSFHTYKKSLSLAVFTLRLPL